MTRRTTLAITGLLALASFGCGIIGFVADPAPLAGPAYWTAVTATPIPTVTRFLGTTTPVYAPTPPPGLITTTPFWTRVTATPLFPPPTATPVGFVATPFWVTTTPLFITETPQPPVTTTPALPIIGFTTPVPLQTPYYRVGRFYMHSDVYVGGPHGLVFRITAHESQPSPRDAAAAYHFVTVRVTNHTAEPAVVPVADLVFARQVLVDGVVRAGRWTPQNEPLIARSLPAYETQQLPPIPPGDSREVVLGFVLPAGELPEIGLITNWQRPLEGGLPIWFRLQADPLGPFVDALHPPPPTPLVLDDDLWAGAPPPGGGGGGGGNGRWPAQGTITRGFGCHAQYTGIDGAGFGCPTARPWFHNGVDIANTAGTTIVAPIDGTLHYAGPNPTGPDCAHIAGSQAPHEGLGNYQRLGDGQTLHYLGHLRAFTRTGGAVTAGEAIAEMGSTGCSTGSHLHWTLYQNGHLIDPAAWTMP